MKLVRSKENRGREMAEGANSKTHRSLVFFGHYKMQAFFISNICI